MTLNGKSFENWSLTDLNLLVDNDDYRENDTINYKEDFSQLYCENKQTKKIKQDEFRHDVCSFANAEGGHLIYGIAETNGIPSKISGITVTDDNIDKFELDRRNELSLISPIMPSVKFGFIACEEGKYVVIIKISKGYYVPHVCLDNDSGFKFYVRRGNKKQMMKYTELKNMFNQSLMLSERIDLFRKSQIDKYLDSMSEEKKPFCMIQVIPESFMDTETFIEAYKLCRNSGGIQSVFYSLCTGYPAPNVDGAIFNEYTINNKYSFQIYNNMTTEAISFFDVWEKGSLRYLLIKYTFKQLYQLIHGTSDMYKFIGCNYKSYICISIIGCKGLISQIEGFNDYNCIVDRNNIYCIPIEVNNLADDDEKLSATTRAEKTFLYAVGATRNPETLALV